jgi:hypothetical protein
MRLDDPGLAAGLHQPDRAVAEREGDLLSGAVEGGGDDGGVRPPALLAHDREA